MQNHLTSPSTTTQNNTSASQVLVTDKSPTVHKSSKKEVPAGLGTTNGKWTSTGSTGQQRALTSAPPPKPAVCSAATTTRQRTMQDARPAATSGHADSTSPVTATSSASGRPPGCPRRDQRPDRRLGGSSHQSRTWCFLGVRARTSASLA